MNFLIKLIIFISIDIYIFISFGKPYGLLGIGFILYYLFDILSIFHSLKISSGNFNGGVAYLKDYQGPLHNPQAFKDSLYLIKNFKLKDFVIIGIYYDKPDEVEKNKLRYSIGIFKKKGSNKGTINKDFENYCNKNNFYHVEFPDTASICSSWKYSNFFSMMVGIAKFNQLIKKNLDDETFRNMHKITEKPKIVIELYVNESDMEFYIPTANVDKFLVYRKKE